MFLFEVFFLREKLGFRELFERGFFIVRSECFVVRIDICREFFMELCFLEIVKISDNFKNFFFLGRIYLDFYI